MNEWPEIVDLENCVHQAAKEGEAKTLEEVKLDASLGVGSYSLPLEDGLNLIYKHAASIYDNRDQSVTSPLYDQLRERINSNRTAKSVGEFPIAALDTQRHFHALIASKIEMSRIQSFPPIPEEVTIDQVELREGPEGRELVSRFSDSLIDFFHEGAKSISWTDPAFLLFCFDSIRQDSESG